MGLFKDSPVELGACDDCAELKKRVAQLEQGLAQLRRLITQEFESYDLKREYDRYNDGVADGLDVASTYMDRIFGESVSVESAA